ncbi:hypothetical protein CEXT_8481 [Caerostris extrusa]|uniref:Uncharacterized protein n=1 Tax=Caerostris extrusa TaxID=172846 RepID=A0AAV4NBM3_CAEEX|nr:hypothetical protein CEXT_8481 [Caerostris extrusa]
MLQIIVIVDTCYISLCTAIELIKKETNPVSQGGKKYLLSFILTSPLPFPESRPRTCVPPLIITYTHQGEKQNITTVPLAFMAHSLLHHIFLDQAPRLTLLSFLTNSNNRKAPYNASSPVPHSFVMEYRPDGG